MGCPGGGPDIVDWYSGDSLSTIGCGGGSGEVVRDRLDYSQWQANWALVLFDSVMDDVRRKKSR